VTKPEDIKPPVEKRTPLYVTPPIKPRPKEPKDGPLPTLGKPVLPPGALEIFVVVFLLLLLVAFLFG
jgi:hypothetical protein